MARSFDGSGDKIYYSDVPQVSQGTISLWFNAASLPAADTRAAMFVFFDETAAEPFGTYDKLIWINSAGLVRGYIYDGAPKTASSTTAAATGEWHHFALTFDGSNLRAWFDGVNEGTIAAGDAYAGYTNPGFALCGLTLDFAIPEATAARFNGALAEVAVWSAVLTTGEVASLARGYSPAFVRPGSLAVHNPLVRGTNNRRRYDAGAVTGTTIVPHSRIIMPRSLSRTIFVPLSVPVVPPVEIDYGNSYIVAPGLYIIEPEEPDDYIVAPGVYISDPTIEIAPVEPSGDTAGDVATDGEIRRLEQSFEKWRLARNKYEQDEKTARRRLDRLIERAYRKVVEHEPEAAEEITLTANPMALEVMTSPALAASLAGGDGEVIGDVVDQLTDWLRSMARAGRMQEIARIKREMEEIDDEETLLLLLN